MQQHISDDDIIEEFNQMQCKEESDNEISHEDLSEPVVGKSSRLVGESALDSLKDVTIFSEQEDQGILKVERLYENGKLK